MKPMEIAVVPMVVGESVTIFCKMHWKLNGIDLEFVVVAVRQIENKADRQFMVHKILSCWSNETTEAVRW